MSTPAKSETPAKGAAKPEAAAEGAAGAAAPAGGAKAWLPVIAALILAPAATWATVEFVLVPRLQKKLAVAPAGEHGAEAAAPAAHAAPSGGHGGKPAKEGKEGKGGGGANFEFTNVVVNLAGTMGTRYLKTSFIITGADPNIRAVFEGAKPKLTDVTLNVLSSLTLAELEEPGAKNLIREKLVTAYNQALGRKVADQVYFSDFVVQ
ncbi:flagellar basal body-associated FliL family protein [Horticoccus sp. 23ND18S-11]|uniref:flagellar basal body-associated FliL family protein n=1 Tax=Horticoccus sp. 23ND18S-11 TaxID=3391832 RepID=UPI0039C9172A